MVAEAKHSASAFSPRKTCYRCRCRCCRDCRCSSHECPQLHCSLGAYQRASPPPRWSRRRPAFLSPPAHPRLPATWWRRHGRTRRTRRHYRRSRSPEQPRDKAAAESSRPAQYATTAGRFSPRPDHGRTKSAAASRPARPRRSPPSPQHTQSRRGRPLPRMLPDGMKLRSPAPCRETRCCHCCRRSYPDRALPPRAASRADSPARAGALGSGQCSRCRRRYRAPWRRCAARRRGARVRACVHVSGTGRSV